MMTLFAAFALDLGVVFKGSPFIYLTLFALSLTSFSLWLYSLFTLNSKKLVSRDFIKELRAQLLEKRYDTAFITCQNQGLFLGKIVASAIRSRRSGFHVMRESMEAEGKRCGVLLWQRISLLNDIAMIAPMLGLFGTVWGLFLAFYDMNRSAETLGVIFDGLGLAVGTTVAGLIVAIFATIFHAILKFRLTRLLNRLENEASSFMNLIESGP